MYVTVMQAGGTVEEELEENVQDLGSLSLGTAVGVDEVSAVF